MIGQNSSTTTTTTRADRGKARELPVERPAAGMIDENKPSKFDHLKRQLLCGFASQEDSTSAKQQASVESPKSPKSPGRSLFKLSLRGSTVSSSDSGCKQQARANSKERSEEQEESRGSCEHLVRMISDKNLAIDEYNERRRRDSNKSSSELLILLGSQKQQTSSGSSLLARKQSTGSGSNLQLLAKNKHQEQSSLVQQQQEASIVRRRQSELLIEQLNEFNARRKQLQEDQLSPKLEETWSEFVPLESLSPQSSLAEAQSFQQNESIELGKQPACNLKVQQDAIWELCSTEVNYLKRLRLVIDLFLSTLLELQRESLLLDIEPSRMVSNICQVYEANLSLWRQHLEPMVASSRLRRCPLDPAMMRDAFLQIRNTFYPYYKYCLEHTNCLAYVKEQTRTNEHFRLFVAWCESQKECERLRLMDLLAKPMQRLTRYSLLLKAIAKRTDNEEQLRSIELMIAHMNKFVLTVDLELKRKEELERLVSVSNSIEAFAIATGDAYSEEIDRLVKQNQRQFELDRPLFNCPFECRRELLFDSRTCFIHQAASRRSSPSRWANYRLSPRIAAAAGNNNCPAASSQNQENQRPFAPQRQGSLQRLVAGSGSKANTKLANPTISNCSSLSATSGSQSNQQAHQRAQRPAAEVTSGSRRVGACLSLGQLKFRDLQMSGGKLDVTLLIFTDQLLICRPASSSFCSTSGSAARRQQAQTSHLNAYNNNNQPVNLDNGWRGRPEVAGSGKTANRQPNENWEGGGNRQQNRKQLARSARTNMQPLLAARATSNSSSNEAEQASSCHSSTSSIRQRKQLRQAKELFRASRRAESSSRSGDNLENNSHSGRFKMLNKPTPPFPAGPFFRSLSFSNVMLSSAAELFGGGGPPQASLPVPIGAGGEWPFGETTRKLKAIRSPYPIERLRMFELKDGQSVFCCQLNDSLTIATSFLLYTTSAPTSTTGTASGELQFRGTSNSCADSPATHSKEHPEQAARSESDTFNATIKQLFNNLSGAGSADRKRQEATPAAQLISLIKQAQARFHMAANFHGLQLANLNLSQQEEEEAEDEKKKEQLEKAEEEENNNLAGSQLDFDLPVKEQARRSPSKLSAWSSFRHSRRLRKKSPGQSTKNKPTNPDCANKQTTNHERPAGFSPSKAPSSQPEQQQQQQQQRRQRSQPSPGRKSADADLMLKAVAEQHQSMMLNHGLHEQLCAYNYNYRIEGADFRRVVAEPVSLLSTLESVSLSSLSQSHSMITTTTTNNEASSNVCSSSRRVSSSDQLHFYANQPAHFLAAANFNYASSQTGSQNSVFEEAASNRADSLEEAADKQKQLLLSPHRYHHHQKQLREQETNLRGSLDNANGRLLAGLPSASAGSGQADRHRHFSRSARLPANKQISESEQINLMVTTPGQLYSSALTSSSSSPRSSPPAMALQRAGGRAGPEARLLKLCANSLTATTSNSSDDQSAATTTSGMLLSDRLSPSGSCAGRSARSNRRNLSSLKRQNVVLSASSDHQPARNNSSLEYSLLESSTSVINCNEQGNDESCSEEGPLLRTGSKSRLSRAHYESSQANTMDQLSITLDDYDQLCLVAGSATSCQSPAVKATSFELGQLRPALPVSQQPEGEPNQRLSAGSPGGQLRSASIEARSPIAVTLTRPLNDHQHELPASSPSTTKQAIRADGTRYTSSQRRTSYLNIPQNKPPSSSQNNSTRPVAKASSSSDSYFYTSLPTPPSPTRQPVGATRSTGSLSPIQSNASTPPLQANSYQTVIKKSPDASGQLDTEASCSSLNSAQFSQEQREQSLDISTRDSSFEASYADFFNPAESCQDDEEEEWSGTGSRQRFQQVGGNNASRSFEYVNQSAGSNNRLKVALSDAAANDLAYERQQDFEGRGEATLIDMNCMNSLVRQPAVGSEEEEEEDGGELSRGRRYLGFHEKLQLHNQRLEEERQRLARRRETSSYLEGFRNLPDVEGGPRNAANLRTAFSQLTHKSALNIKRAFMSKSASNRKRSSASNPTSSLTDFSGNPAKVARGSQKGQKKAQKAASLTRFDSFLHKAASLRSISSQQANNNNK